MSALDIMSDSPDIPPLDFSELEAEDSVQTANTNLSVNVPPPPTQKKIVAGVEQPDDSTVLKVKRKNSILKCKTLFPIALEGYADKLTWAHLDTLDATQMDNLYQEIRVHIGTYNSANMLPMIFMNLTSIPEKFGPIIGLELEGLQAKMLANEQLKSILNEVSLDYESLCYMPPIYRLGLTSIGIMASVHQENVNVKALKKFIETPVNDQLVDEFEDL